MELHGGAKVMRSAGGGGSALFLGAHPPGQGTGSAVRNMITVEALRSRFESVDVVAFANSGEASFADPSTLLIPRPPPPSRPRTLASLPSGGILFASEREARLRERIEDLVGSGRLRREYDVLWAHQALMAGAAASPVDAGVRVLDVDTVAGPVMRAAAEGVGRRSRRLYGILHAAVASREERRRWARFEHLVVASEVERQRLGRWKEKATVVPNAVPAPESVGDGEGSSEVAAAAGNGAHSSDVLFIGSLDYGPNAEAADLLVRSILPRIRSARGSTMAMIAGRDPLQSLVQLCETEDVRLVASPPSLAPVLAGARVFAAPLRYGGGTKIKVIEAMAHGLPIVATAVAAEGLEIRHGQNALIHDTQEDFAAGCVELLGNRRLANRLGRAAHDTWRRHHRPQAVRESIAALLEELCPP